MIKARKPIPFVFVLDELENLHPVVRPMFGCHAIYMGEKIMLILRDKESEAQDNGVWIATMAEHHESLRKEFPSMRSIQLLGKGETNWQVLPSSAPDFEESAMHACQLVRSGDERIGKIPKSRRKTKRSVRTNRAPRKRKG